MESKATNVRNSPTATIRLILIVFAASLLAVSAPAPALLAVPAAASAVKSGLPVRPKSLTFVQDGLHNCGTVAMLISWAKACPSDAANLVWRQPDGAYLVSFKTRSPISVARADLAAASKARLIRTKNGDDWAKIVLTAFVKLKSQPRKLDFRATDWIYAGEIGSCLTGGRTGDFEIKQETLDKNGRLQVGPPVSSSVLKRELMLLRGKPCVAYTNRRVHIWAVLEYDPQRSRVLVRNPRRSNGEWVSVSEFARRFQLLVYAEGIEGWGKTRRLP